MKYNVKVSTTGGADTKIICVEATSPDKAKAAAVAIANAEAKAKGSSYTYQVNSCN